MKPTPVRRILWVLAILLVLVQLIQAFGDRLVHRFTRS